jgi:hypothetical protein
MKMYAFYSRATGLIIGKTIPVHNVGEERPRPVQIIFRDASTNRSAEHCLGTFHQPPPELKIMKTSQSVMDCAGRAQRRRRFRAFGK